MKDMTPKMVAALVAAAEAEPLGGLAWTGGRWIVPGREDGHGPVVVSRLVWNHGYLAETGAPGRGEHSRRSITKKGKAWLAAKRPQASDRTPDSVRAEK